MPGPLPNLMTPTGKLTLSGYVALLAAAAAAQRAMPRRKSSNNRRKRSRSKK